SVLSDWCGLGEAPSREGSPREGARSELASGAATGGGGAQVYPVERACERSGAPQPYRALYHEPQSDGGAKSSVTRDRTYCRGSCRGSLTTRRPDGRARASREARAQGRRVNGSFGPCVRRGRRVQEQSHDPENFCVDSRQTC